LKFSELVNINDLKRLCEDFTSMTGMVTAILDLDGNILVATGWQDICTCFHRVNPITAARCRESDTMLAGEVKKNKKVTIYKCKNGLVDVAVPVKIRGAHVANFFTGQFFLEPPDKEFFIQQAENYGFDRDTYLDALSKVPILPLGKVKSAMAFFSHLGQLFGEMGLARKELEEANKEMRLESTRFRESEKRFRILVNTIPDLIWLKNAEGVYLSCNEMYERFLGAKEADIVGKAEYDFVDKELADFFRELDCNAMDTERPSSAEKWITFADDGHRALLNITKIPMHATDGTFIGVLGIGRDLTNLRQAENERAALQNQLHQVQKIESIGVLAGGVAHDFNNMLGAITGHAELALMRKDDTDLVIQHLNEILKAAKRSSSLTTQLVAFARKQAVNPKVINVNDAIEGILNMIRSLIGEQISITLSQEPDLWPVKIDPNQIDQILINLCCNSRDAMNGSGTISIATENISFTQDRFESGQKILSGDYIRLRVKDHGCGMDEATKSHIFEPFFTTKEIGKGTGLGLSAVFGIIQQNNGFIKVGSQLGQGTSFELYLPRTHAEVTKDVTEKITSSCVDGNATILLVEDEEILLELTKTVLESQGYTVLCANTPEKALKIAQTYEGHIDLLLTDIMMPLMNGNDLAQKIKT